MARAPKDFEMQDPHGLAGKRDGNLETAIGREVRTFRRQLDMTVAELYFDRVSRSNQQRLLQQKHAVMAWRTVDQCAQVAQLHGARVALRVLVKRVLLDPQLLRYRPVWGALRRLMQ